MTPTDYTALTARLREGITPGPWEAEQYPGMWYIVPADHYGTVCSTGLEPNARLIAAAPSLLDAIDALAAENARLSAEVERVTSDRQFIIGANHGFDTAKEQAQAEIDALAARAADAENEAHDCGAEREKWKTRAEDLAARVAELEVAVDDAHGWMVECVTHCPNPDITHENFRVSTWRNAILCRDKLAAVMEAKQ